MADDVRVRGALPDDLDWIFSLRHRVYAEELGQHAVNDRARLTDALDGDNTYLVAAQGDTPIGFVSLTPPWAGRYGLDKYLTREELPLLDEPDVFEVRILTVEPGRRAEGIATLLMYAALRWTISRGGREIVAMGRDSLLEMYRAVGLEPIGRTIVSGSVEFEVMTATTARLTSLAVGPYAELVERWAAEVDWQLDAPMTTRRDGCEHGGASFAAIGTGFEDLGQRSHIVAADVLDAWFAPAPAVTAALTGDTEWLAHTSPPADASGLIAQIALSRGLPAESVAVGAGSSDLIFRALTRWLSADSRVLLISPSYGEYAHVTERVVGCRVDRFHLSPDDDWRIDTGRLADAVLAGRYDLVVLVNPNNPTGRHLPAAEVRDLIAATASSESTRWWIDEAYLGYVGMGESLAGLAAADPRVVVCSSMSKMYALSGLRAAFLVAAPETAADLRRLTPPWQVSLPAQIAGVLALRDPAHYERQWSRTRELRGALAADLRSLRVTGLAVDESVANFLTITLPPAGPSAHRLVASCRDRGVFLRDVSPLSAGYRGHAVRIAVKDSPENELIVAACAAALA